MNKNVSVLAVGVTLLFGCTTTSDVVQTDLGQFMISATGTSPSFTGTQDAISLAYQDASKHCASKGKSVETISLDKVEQALGKPGRATLQFKCVISTP